MTHAHPRERDALAALPPLARAVEWRVSDALVPYDDAVREMETRATAIAKGDAAELVWLLEHPPLYTAGTSASDDDILSARFPVHRSNRGGQMTYHGPGQRVVYVLLDLTARGRDVRRFVASLEAWLIETLSHFGVTGERREDRVGVWVRRPDRPPVLIDGAPTGAEDKIAAIGIRLRRWVTFHGISLNVEPELDHFGGIVPCGVEGHGVTSLVDLGVPVQMADVDIALRQAFDRVFGASSASEGRQGSDPEVDPKAEFMAGPKKPGVAAR